MSDVPPYKDSARFNVYDLHVIVSGIFNNVDAYFTAKVIKVFPISSFEQYLLLEVIPLYMIKRIDGIFVKKPLQNYSNVHTVVVPRDVGEKMKQLLRKVDSKTSVIISFKKQWMPCKRVKFDNDGIIIYYFILPGKDIVTSLTAIHLFYAEPKTSYCPEYEFVPKGLPTTHIIRNFVFISELEWRVCYLKLSPRDKKSNTGQNSKSIDYSEESVLGKKLNCNKGQLEKTSEPVSKECVCFLKNCNPIVSNSNNLSIKSQSNSVKKPEEITKAKQVIINQEPLETLEAKVKQMTIKQGTLVAKAKQVITKQEPPQTLESPKIIQIDELMPFRLVDEKVDTRNDISHLYWIHQ